MSADVVKELRRMARVLRESERKARKVFSSDTSDWWLGYAVGSKDAASTLRSRARALSKAKR